MQWWFDISHVYRLGEIGWTDKSIWPWKVGQRSELIKDIGKTQQMYRFGIDVMFWWGNIALTSKVQGCNDLSDLEKWVKSQPRSLPFELIWDFYFFLNLRYWQNAANVPFCHWCDVSFRQFCGNKQSHGKGQHTKVKGQRAKIIVWGTRTGHGKYAVMVWCQ